MAEAFDLWPTATRIAKEYGLDPALFRGLIRAESGGTHFKDDGSILTSSSGALGYTQLLPGTAAGMGFDPNDPEDNLRGGASYLAAQMKEFGSPKLALAAYNAGPNAVRSHGGVPDFSETQKYVKKVLAYAAEFPGEGGGIGEDDARKVAAEVYDDNKPNIDFAQSLFKEGEEAQLQDPKMELLRLMLEGPLETEDLLRVTMLKRQQMQDERTSAEIQAAETAEKPDSKQTPTTNTTSGPSKKEWGALKGVGNTSMKFMLKAIKKAQDLGLAVRENPYVDPVDPVHTEGSYHDKLFPGQVDGKRVGRGLDVSGAAEAMDAFFRWAIKFRPTELFYDPLGQYDSGRYSSQGIGKHDTHVHLSV